MKKENLVIFIMALVIVGLLAAYMSQQKAPPLQSSLSESIMLSSADIQWKTAPASLPAGAKFALIEGNLSQSEPFTFRLLLPANYTLAPHRHPAVEHVTVLSGALYFGEGEKFDLTKAKLFPAGSIVIMPKGAPMFGFTSEETIIQVHGVGPWGIAYANSADDPRNKK